MEILDYKSEMLQLGSLLVVYITPISEVSMRSKGVQPVLLDEVPSVQRPVNLQKKRSLFQVTSSNERCDPFVVLDDSPGPQYPDILEPLGIEARELEVEDPKSVPLIQHDISRREVEVSEHEWQR